MTMAIVKYIGGDRSRFKELMDVFFSGEYRLTQRAAWPISYIAEEQPQLIRPFIGRCIAMLGEKHHPAIHRNILRMFEVTAIPEKYSAGLLDHCFRFIASESHPVAVRAFAITVASNITRNFPELNRELRLLLDELLVHPQPPAIRSRVKKALKHS
jgi:hypothetical protein